MHTAKLLIYNSKYTQTLLILIGILSMQLSWETIRGTCHWNELLVLVT